MRDLGNAPEFRVPEKLDATKVQDLEDLVDSLELRVSSFENPSGGL